MSNEISLEKLLHAGVHFGHKTSKWHPKMSQYIYTSRNGVHIIHLEKTVAKLNEAAKFLEEKAGAGKTILLVGTKDQAKEIVKKAAEDAGMPYVVEKWMGGTLTNFGVISRLTKKLKTLETKKGTDEWNAFTKKEKLVIDREVKKLEINVGGIRDLTRLPDALFVIDVKNEETAVREAIKLKIPIVAMIDSNSDPEGISYIIPSNDDATKSIALIVGFLAEAIKRGKAEKEAAIAEKSAEVEKKIEEKKEEVVTQA
ncbi:MAG: 30S ribosomal protein S2 [Patescibacteria group bacterium]